MHKGRLEAFSDGVLAIIITVMVLELHAPHEPTLETLRPLVSALLSYVLSFLYVGIYWNNHHHLMQAASRVGGAALWANLHLLFWLSLVPFTTGWMGETHFATVPVAAYGVVLLMAAIAFVIFQHALLRLHGSDSLLAEVAGVGIKGKISIALYAGGIALAFRWPWVSGGLYAAAALMWLIPDRRIERVMSRRGA